MSEEERERTVEDDFYYSVTNGEFETLKKLIAEHPNTTLTAVVNGRTLLQHACFFGKHEVIPVLLTAGCDPSSKEEETGWTALHFAAVDGYAACIKELFKSDKVNPAELNAYKQTAFHLLCDAVCDYSDCIPLFMDLPNAKEICNLVDESGKTPVSRTITNSNMDHLKALLKYPFVDLDLAGEEGRSAYGWAQRFGNVEAQSLLAAYKP